MVVLGIAGPWTEHICRALVWNLFFKPKLFFRFSFVSFLSSVFFTLMSCTGQKLVFYKLNNRKKCLFSAKICLKCFGKHLVYSMFYVISLKFIANWDANFPSYFFLLLKIENLLNFFFFLGAGSLLATKSVGLGPWPPWLSLKTASGYRNERTSVLVC